MMVTFSGVFHWGFNISANIAEATNLAFEDQVSDMAGLFYFPSNCYDINYLKSTEYVPCNCFVRGELTVEQSVRKLIRPIVQNFQKE